MHRRRYTPLPSLDFLPLVKPNYQFEKRQRELEKKRKQEEKRLRDLAAKSLPDATAGQNTNDLPAATADDAGKPG